MNEKRWLQKLDMTDIWLNSAYDENGDEALCDICGGEMRWDEMERNWCCPQCGERMNRQAYLNHIGAQPPGDGCRADCEENYPLCKRTCTRYAISPDDPMRT